MTFLTVTPIRPTWGSSLEIWSLVDPGGTCEAIFNTNVVFKHSPCSARLPKLRFRSTGKYVYSYEYNVVMYTRSRSACRSLGVSTVCVDYWDRLVKMPTDSCKNLVEPSGK